MTQPRTIIVQAGVHAGTERIINLPAHEYHGMLERQSCSQLKPMLKSPASYCSTLLSRSSPSGDSIDFGTLVHMRVLEPDLFAQAVAIYPSHSVPGSRDRDFSSFKKANKGRIVVDESGLASIIHASNRLLEQRVLGRPFGDFVATGTPEVTYLFDDPTTGIPCRCRLDLSHEEAVFDIKTTRPGPWKSHAIELGYDMQSYMYSLAETLHRGGETAKPFIFMCSENDASHATYARRAGDSFLEQGKRKYEFAISVLAACQQTNYWPNSTGEETIEISPWEVFTPPPGPWTTARQ